DLVEPPRVSQIGLLADGPRLKVGRRHQRCDQSKVRIHVVDVIELHRSGRAVVPDAVRLERRGLAGLVVGLRLDHVDAGADRLAFGALGVLDVDERELPRLLHGRDVLARQIPGRDVTRRRHRRWRQHQTGRRGNVHTESHGSFPLAHSVTATAAGLSIGAALAGEHTFRSWRRLPSRRAGHDKAARMVRLLTYNVHRCVGTDRRLDVGRVAEVIDAQSPDIVALQELDVGRARTGGVDQAQFGDAILTTLPERLVKAGPIPGHPRFPQLEPRGAVWVEIDTADGVLSVVNTHLGLVPREQRIQAEALAGKDWTLAAAPDAPLVLVGDMNATPRSAAYRILASRLAEARRAAPFSHRAPTFPSTFPVLAIDHVFASEGVVIDAVRTPLDPLSRLASDHLPLVVDFSLAPRKPTA